MVIRYKSLFYWHLYRNGDNGLKTWWHFLFGSWIFGSSSFCISLSRNVWNLNLKTAGEQFFNFTSNFYDSMVGRLAYLTLDWETWVQIPCLDHFFYTFIKLVLLCGEHLFSAISKMLSIIFVAYQKVEKTHLKECGKKRRKITGGARIWTGDLKNSSPLL